MRARTKVYARSRDYCLMAWRGIRGSKGQEGAAKTEGHRSVRTCEAEGGGAREGGQAVVEKRVTDYWKCIKRHKRPGDSHEELVRGPRGVSLLKRVGADSRLRGTGGGQTRLNRCSETRG